jgi:hypothetical protein
VRGLCVCGGGGGGPSQRVVWLQNTWGSGPKATKHRGDEDWWTPAQDHSQPLPPPSPPPLVERSLVRASMTRYRSRSRVSW